MGHNFHTNQKIPARGISIPPLHCVGRGLGGGAKSTARAHWRLAAQIRLPLFPLRRRLRLGGGLLSGGDRRSVGSRDRGSSRPDLQPPVSGHAPDRYRPGGRSRADTEKLDRDTGEGSVPESGSPLVLPAGLLLRGPRPDRGSGFPAAGNPRRTRYAAHARQRAGGRSRIPDDRRQEGARQCPGR